MKAISWFEKVAELRSKIWDMGESNIVNKVGTFGVNCASYWWARISAAGLRATYGLIGPCPVDMLRVLCCFHG